MKIVLLEPLGISAENLNTLSESLVNAGHEFVAFETRTDDTGELIQRAEDADIVVIANMPFRKAVISRCPRLKMISVAFTGVDHVDLDECRARGIAVCNAAGYSTNAVAELTFGMILSLLRYVTPCEAALRNGGTKGSLIGSELSGLTLGVVGTGAIGQRVAELGKAFGCTLLAYSRTPKKSTEALGVQYVSIETLLSQSDIVTLHLPLNDSTRGLINAERLSLMKPTALLVNTARGPVVDNAALAQALRDGKIAGAGVDVFETEPPIASDHPLLSAPNTLLTPHIAFATKQSLYKRAVIAFNNVTAWLSGAPQNAV